MKKSLYKAFRRARRNLCRFILGFERCPKSYRKNYKQMTVDAVYGLLLGAVTTLIFGLMMLYSS